MLEPRGSKYVEMHKALKNYVTICIVVLGTIYHDIWVLSLLPRGLSRYLINQEISIELKDLLWLLGLSFLILA